jgi:hypothetical protein
MKRKQEYVGGTFASKYCCKDIVGEIFVYELKDINFNVCMHVTNSLKSCQEDTWAQ